MALWLAFFDQGCASTAIINYAPQVLEAAGITDYGDATLWSSGITAAKVRLVNCSSIVRLIYCVCADSPCEAVYLLGMCLAYHKLQTFL